jgi:dihydropteroate synthase
MQLKINNILIDLTSPIVMGIVNVTPDSFFAGSRFNSNKSILNCVEKMLSEGATIIDIGGYSTRPMAENITDEEEISRLSKALEIILSKFPDIKISVDTFRSNVARHVVLNYNVGMINDISGGSLDNFMFETIADLKVAYVLMHTRGNPQNMQNMTDYNFLISEIIDFLQRKIVQLHLLGVHDVIIDPGFGFAKTTEQNFEILNKLHYFKELKMPILAGLSRKSMLYKTLNIEPEDTLNATTAANVLALQGGASILRVHDVKEAMQAIKIYNTYMQSV